MSDPTHTTAEAQTETTFPTEATGRPQAQARPQVQRDANGRFAIGNDGGPGNPFARQTAALHSAFLQRATPQDMKAIADKLIEQAKGGNVAAAKLVLQYTIGKPAPAVSRTTSTPRSGSTPKPPPGSPCASCKRGWARAWNSRGSWPARAGRGSPGTKPACFTKPCRRARRPRRRRRG